MSIRWTKKMKQSLSGVGNQILPESKGLILIRLMAMMKGGFWIYLTAIVAMSIAMSAFSTITAMLLKNIIHMAQTGTYDGIVKMVVQNVFAGFTVLLINMAGSITYTIQAKKGCANLQKKVLAKAVKMPYEYYENTHSGEFMSKMMYDETRTEDVYGSRFRRITMPALMVIFYLIPMYALSWQVTSCLLVICVITFLINTLFVNPIRKISRQLSETHTSVTERLSNIISGMELMKLYSLDKKMADKYVDENGEFLKGQKKMNVITSCLEGVNNFFDLASSLLFLAVGIYFVSIGITSVENLAAIYVIYGYMNWNFLQVGKYIPSMANCLTNAKRVFEFLDAEEEPERFKNVSAAAGNGFVEMEQVTFSYDGENKVLDNFSMHIEEGKTVALKGESGKGKSTVAKILLGLYPVTAGKISINGRAFSDMSLKEIRDMTGYVPQEPFLYNVSIAENIGYGKTGASKEEIVQAAKAANAHEFILLQEKGYDTVVGERGNRLSGGEKQRIAIARAILKNAPVLILDEATSALDNESERLVSEALDRLMEKRTTIMIAHRPSTIERADIVVELC